MGAPLRRIVEEVAYTDSASLDGARSVAPSGELSNVPARPEMDLSQECAFRPQRAHVPEAGPANRTCPTVCPMPIQCGAAVDALQRRSDASFPDEAGPTPCPGSGLIRVPVLLNLWCSGCSRSVMGDAASRLFSAACRSAGWLGPPARLLHVACARARTLGTFTQCGSSTPYASTHPTTSTGTGN